uniref:BTB domain-containing protein n=1 Tax=Elaeophora elaphi TaxID=1147741 RepID=A0A0R3S1B0_9BILA
MANPPTSLGHGSVHQRNSDQDHTYCSTSNASGAPLSHRLTQFRNENIGCDVEFIVGTEQKAVKAHRLVLGCGSEVFAAMFYGKMTQGRQEDNLMTVVIPDITPSAFTTLINFLYSDMKVDATIELDDDDVMQTLYAAKKYDVKDLILACIRYLTTCLTASNALCLLSQARFFDEPLLIKHCFRVIDSKTDEVLQSPGLRDIDRDTLVTVLKRSELDPSSELVIFRAAQSWSEAECDRRGMEINPSNQREVLGPVLSLIRFPLMTVHEFGEAATSSLLNCEEIAQVFLHMTVVPRPAVSYPTDLRCSGRSRHVVKRFRAISNKRYNRREYKICFMVDREIFVSGFGVFGFTKPHLSFFDSPTTDSSATGIEWRTEVEIQISPSSDVRDRDLIIGCASATETVVVQGRMDDEKPVVASFREPVPVRPNIHYVAGVKFLSSVQTYGGTEGIEKAKVSLPFAKEVSFHFQSFRSVYGNEDDCRFEGQLPEIHFLVQWPEGTH